MSSIRRRAAFTWLVPLVLALPSIGLACPACKDALEGDAVGRALSWTTLMMIAVPMALVAGIGGWVFFVYWRAAREGGAAAADVSWPLWAEKESET